MRVVLRVVAWIWIVISGLGVIFAVLSLSGDGSVGSNLIVVAFLMLPGVVLLSLTKSKAPKD